MTAGALLGLALAASHPGALVDRGGAALLDEIGLVLLADPGVTVVAGPACAAASARLTLTLRNGATGPARLGSLLVTGTVAPALGGDPGRWLAFADGRTMNDVPVVARGRVAATGVLALAGPLAALAVGSVSRSAEAVLTAAGGRVEVRFDLAGTELAPGAALEVATLVVAGGRDLDRALEAWAVAAFPEPAAARPLSGWCSWYATATPDERMVLEQARIAAQLGLSVVQLDDGWQRAAGEWEPNARFPSGLGELVRRIRSLGLEAGLWLAPFAAADSSAIVRFHPDWLLRRGDGSPLDAGERADWGGRIVRLDPSRPEVVDWLAALAARATRQWGFRYLKLDFLAWGVAAERADRSLTPVAAWRRAVEAMRAAAAPGTYVLGCDAPIAVSAGLFEAMRTGPDARLEAARQTVALAAIMRRLHWRRAFVLDPDAVWAGEGVALAEAVARAAFPVLLGGAWFSGDLLTALGPERRALVAGLARAAAAGPPYVRRGPGAVALSAPIGRGAHLLVAANAGPDEAAIAAPSGLFGPLPPFDPALAAEDAVLAAGRFGLRVAFPRGQAGALDPLRPLQPLETSAGPAGELHVALPAPAPERLWSLVPGRCPEARMDAVSAPGVAGLELAP